MKNTFAFVLIALMFGIGFSSCDDDDDDVVPVATKTVVQVAQDNGYSSLATALQKAGLVDDLQAAGSFTVFAPTNAAFDDLLAAIGQASIDDIPSSVLQEILLYHVIGASVKSADISDGDVATLGGSPVTITTAGGIRVNGASVINPFDLDASNGVVHTVDAVLIPPSVSQFVGSVLQPAYFSESFTTLIEAAVKADVVDLLLTTPNLTIFAPDNMAFETSGIVPADLDADLLESVLTYHVIGAKVLSSAIPRVAGTVNGERIYFSLGDGGNFINGMTEITAVDIESGTGVVHVIDQVLLPPTGNIVETAIALSADGEFTSLIAALQRTADEGSSEQNLLTVLSGEGPFTVFAPTNAAFDALLESNVDWNALEDIPLDLLISVLTYHVVPARAYDKDLAGAIDDSGELPTAFGQNIRVDLTNLSINSSSNIMGVNNNTTNGVIHVIDAVLLPN